jgi:DNA-binding transcriptional MocR family regulator
MSNFSAVPSTSSHPLDDFSPNPKYINLLRGWPNPSLLPTQVIKDAANETLSNLPVAKAGMLYGPDAGWLDLRREIAKWTTAFYQPKDASGDRATEDVDRITITGGASQSLGVLLSVYSDPHFTRAVWCVVPSYMLAFRIFDDAGFAEKMMAVPEDAEGCDMAALRKALKECDERVEREGKDEVSGFCNVCIIARNKVSHGLPMQEETNHPI